MASEVDLIIELGSDSACNSQIVGAKAARLSELIRAGFRVPCGFCISSQAYFSFLHETGLKGCIEVELGRKSLDDMRWEEIWDSALRIRSKFLSHELSANLAEAIIAAWDNLFNAPVAVRSSAIDEDRAAHSFAGLHESLLNVGSKADLFDAVRIVWASLWSDAALLYRSELGLKPSESSMAVLVQQMVHEDRSGVAFSKDPRGFRPDVGIVEAVVGPCSQLVDGLIDPDHWEINRKTNKILSWIPGQRLENANSEPLLNKMELDALLQTLTDVEALYDWAPDIEWTGRQNSLFLLQARPITTSDSCEKDPAIDKRAWYLTLRPGDVRLRQLRQRVTQELIPELTREGIRLSNEALDHYDDCRLSQAIAERRDLVEKWTNIYWEDFIPFAHGVRRLATFYNDALCPGDPYEFVGLLMNQQMLATKRNRIISELALELNENDELKTAIRVLLDKNVEELTLKNAFLHLTAVPRAQEFLSSVEVLDREHFDIFYNGVRLCDDLRAILHTIYEFSESKTIFNRPRNTQDPLELERLLLNAVGPERENEAKEIIETARVSWTLRDDDNLLLARIESQLLRAAEIGANRLRAQKRLQGSVTTDTDCLNSIINALGQGSTEFVMLEKAPEKSDQNQNTRDVKPRQLVGQPASPGVASGRVRRITGSEDLGKFCVGEVLVCDAIQPMMTHIVPLACAVVERRGGMLIHGAIIARELAIPCVNGVRNASSALADGQLVTVDGNLGIVTVGGPEF